MEKEEFVKILTEEGIGPERVESLWDSRPTDNLDEEGLRATCKDMLSSPLGPFYRV